MAVAGLLALSSCSNDDNEELNVNNTPRQMTFTAGFGSDAAQTRATLDHTTLDAANKQVLFDANDQISIISANNTNTAFSTTESGKSVSFTGYANADTEYYSVYPYTDGLTLSGTTIYGIVIPANQWNSDWGNSETSGTSSWDPKAPVAWTVTENTSLQFHNLCAILKIHTIGTGSSTITISADEALAGAFTLDINTSSTPSTAALATTASSTNSVTTYSAVAAGKYLYIAIAPGTKTNFRVVSAGTDMKKEDKFNFEAGKVYYLGEFAVNK